jgi:hypothetical protein
MKMESATVAGFAISCTFDWHPKISPVLFVLDNAWNDA